MPIHSDTRTRAILAYGYSIFVGLSLGYIIVVHGDQKEILTLIIGIIGGTILGGVYGTYFAASNNKGVNPSPEGTTTADISATITTENKPDTNGN